MASDDDVNQMVACMTWFSLLTGKIHPLAEQAYLEGVD